MNFLYFDPMSRSIESITRDNSLRLKKKMKRNIFAGNYVLVIASRLVFTNAGKKENLIIEGIAAT